MGEIQCGYLDSIVAVHGMSTIIMVNGYQMRGKITDYDDDCILVEIGENNQLVYKSAVSTIVREKTK